MGNLILIAIIIFGVYQCTGGRFGTDKIFGPPDELPLDRYEDMDVSVWFYYPNGIEEYLGDTTGASSCGSIAWDWARQKEVTDSEWGYVCCTHEADSQCYRKIR